MFESTEHAYVEYWTRCDVTKPAFSSESDYKGQTLHSEVELQEQEEKHISERRGTGSASRLQVPGIVRAGSRASTHRDTHGNEPLLFPAMTSQDGNHEGGSVTSSTNQ